MRSVNKVILIGNLTRDPELRETTGGNKIVTFGIATNREWVNSTGEKKSEAEFHSIVAWGKLAELCVTLLKKGDLVYIEGSLKTRSFDHVSGIKVSKCEIVADSMLKCSRRIDAPGEDMPTVTKEKSADMPANDNDDFFADMDSVMPEESEAA